MKNMKKILTMVYAMLLCPFSPVNGNIKIPEELDQLISQAIAIKMESMKHPTPRKDNTFSNSFANIMNKIGETEIENFIFEEIIKHQKNDVRLKIIVWAKDRNNRKEEYNRFAKSYVNEPLTQDDLVLIWQAKYPGDKITEEHRKDLLTVRYTDPCRVPKEELVEKNRAMIEYHFYAPFTRSGNVSDFRVQYVKPSLLEALLKLGDREKSHIMLMHCVNTAIEAESVIGENFNKKEISDALSVFTSYPDQTSFQFISQHWQNDFFRECVTDKFSQFSEERYSTTMQGKKVYIYDEWQVLAAKEWDHANEKAFAEWLKKLAAPPEPPPAK
jgi:hypothetical protein